MGEAAVRKEVREPKAANLNFRNRRPRAGPIDFAGGTVICFYGGVRCFTVLSGRSGGGWRG